MYGNFIINSDVVSQKHNSSIVAIMSDIDQVGNYELLEKFHAG